jgi:TP901 family phage tail tape measure protein
VANSAVVGLLRALLVADTAEFDAAMKRAGDSAKAWSKDLKKIGAEAEAVGRTLTVGITAPLVGLGAAASKLAIDFESSFAGVRKTVDGSEADFSKLSQQFRDLAKQIPVNVNELNKLGESAGALGIPRAQIAKFVEVMAGLGTATNLTADEAATSIARIQNIFGAAGQDTDRFASTLVALGNAGASTEKEITEMSARIAGAGHAVGLSQAQVLAFSSTLASVGINAEAGGSAMSRVLLKMNDAVDKGGTALKGFATVAGVSAAEFKRVFETDAAGATVKFVEGLQRLQTAGGNLSATLEPLIGKNIILKDTMLRLAGAGDLMQRDLNNANAAWEKNNALQNETQKRYETTAAQLTILWNRIKDVGISIGQALLPTVRALTEMLASAVPYLEALAKWFSDLPTGIQVAIVAFAGLAAAMGPALIAFGSMSTGLGTLVKSFKAGGIAAEAFGGMMTFLAANPIVAVIAGLGLLAAAIYLVATAETAAEREVRTNAAGYRDQTKALDDALNTYDDLRAKQNLTAKETKDLDAATRQLAEASGLTVDAFNQQQQGSDALTVALREQLKARQDLLREAIAQAKAKADTAQAQLAAAQAQQNKVLMGQATKPTRIGFGGKTDARLEPLTAPKDILEASIKLNAEIATLKHNATEAWSAYNTLNATTAAAAPATNAAADATKKDTDAKKTNTGATTELTKAQEKAKKAAADHAEAVEKLGRSISVGGVTDKISAMAEAVTAASRSGGLAKDSLIQYGKQINDWMIAGQQVPPALADIHYEYLLLHASTQTAKDSMRAFLAVSTDLTPALRANWTEAQKLDAEAEKLGQVFSKAGDQKALQKTLNKLPAVKLTPLTDAAPGFGKTLGADLVAQVPQSIQKAFQGGGDVGKSVGATVGNSVGGAAGKVVGPAISKAVGGGLGKAIGGLAGNAIPIIGPIIGAAVGGLIDKAFSHKGRDATVAFAESAGGFDTLHTKLGALGAEGETMWKRLTGVGKKDEKGAEKIIGEIEAAFDKAKEKQEKLTAGIGKLSGALQVFGGAAPKSLRPMIEALQKSSGLSAEMQKALAAMAKDPSWQTLQQRAQDLGVDLNSLGSQFQSAKLSDIALGYARDLQAFADIGADIPGVLAGMADELSSLYQQAKKNGVALPDTLKPYMDTLVAMGLLVDENGEKVETLNEVTFTKIEDQALQAVVDVLKEIRDLLSDGLPEAAKKGQQELDKNPLTVPVEYEYHTPDGKPFNYRTPKYPVAPPTAPPPAPPPQIGLQGGTHGQYVDWGSGTPVVLHGREAVTPEGEMISGGGGAPIQITVISKLDGREVARNQIKYIPRELTLAGV